MISPAPLFAILFTWTIVTAASAETATVWKGTSAIQFSGTSTMHDWSGKVATEPFVAVVTMDERGRPAALKAKLQVQTAKMDIREPKLDEDMRHDMMVSEHPLIIGNFDTPFDKVMPGGTTPSKLPFALTILGRPQAVEGRISSWSMKGNTATFDLDFELSLKKCGIDVPAVLLVMRVGDTIQLHASVKLVRQSA